MKKITILLLILFISALSCGKKGDPVYEGNNKNINIIKIV